MFHLLYFDGDFLGEPAASIFYTFDIGLGDFEPGFGDFVKLLDFVSFLFGGSATWLADCEHPIFSTNNYIEKKPDKINNAYNASNQKE